MNVFKDLTNGFSTFVLAWLVPSTVISTVLVFILYPIWEARLPSNLDDALLFKFISSGPVASTAAFALLVVILALTSSLASRALYRLLEGYTLPYLLARPMLRRQLRRMRALERQSFDRRVGHTRMAMAQEHLASYPSHKALVLPTRLGNALRALEKFGTDHYRLDSQSFYYELCAVVPGQSTRDLDQARAPVDFFVSFTGLLAILSLLSFVTGIANGSILSLIICLISLSLSRIAYLVAVQNMTDWRYAMQSMINVGRPKLAEALGYRLPETIDEEVAFWEALKEFLDYGEAADLEDFDHLRRPAKTSEGDSAPK